MRHSIELHSISKCYRIFKNPQDRFKQALLQRLENLTGHRGRASPFYREHWALRNIDFSLETGEAIGIVGRNGAGKTTLLQIIAGTLAPTCGTVNTNGRITALLELGSGFNPEFTGRENVFLNAQILGLTRESTFERFDEIANFADIGDFIDQPVKIYSSGMMMRLAFAVQTVLDPDILIVDEALSVGDAKFQEKCFRKLHDLRARGTTILLVSHDVNAVTSFCDRALLLEGGEIITIGKPVDIAKKYLELLYSDVDASMISASEASKLENSMTIDQPGTPDVGSIGTASSGATEYRFGTKGVEIISVEIRDRLGHRTEAVVSGERYEIAQKIISHCHVTNLSSGFVIRNRRGVDLFGITNKTAQIKIPDLKPGTVLEVSIDVEMWLAAGDYFLQAANAGEDGIQYDCRIDAVHFTVIQTPSLFTTSIVNLNPIMHLKVLSDTNRVEY